MAGDKSPRHLHGPALAAWGFLVAKVVAAAFVIDEGPRAALAFFTGFLGDAGIVLALVILALIGANKRGVGIALTIVGALFALWSLFNVYFMVAHGSPLAPAMLKYAG